MKRRSSKGIDRGLYKSRAEQSIAVDNLGFEMHSTPLAGRPDRELIQRISVSGNKASYKNGSIFFAHGEKPSGIFLMLEGAAKLSIASSDGKTLILGFVGPGAILGLAATILGKTYEATATTVRPTTAIFLRRDAVLKLVRQSTKVAFEAAELLSDQCFALVDELRTIGLSESAQQRVAAFFSGLRLVRKRNGACIRLPGVTHEDLAQKIGLSRETTSRILSRLKKRRVLDWRRSSVVIHDWCALQELSASQE